MVNLTENINGIIKKTGYTQEYIASVLKITQGNLSQKIGQNQSIKFSTLYEISNIIGVRVIDIITYPEEFDAKTATCGNCTQLMTVIKQLTEYNEVLKINKEKK
jgi:transcriptional regulator with XRE-family HTH domain